MDSEIDFIGCFQKLTDNKPFHWQQEMYKRFLDNDLPDKCDVPTGLGKTSSIAIWLLALGEALIKKQKPRRIPLRLIYVVDRRVIVDQSTDEVMRVVERLTEAEKEADTNKNPLSKIAVAIRNAAFVKDGPLVSISTLRGQMAENREWCLDPSRPAIIIGTVDMVGSRLLFSAYGGVGRSHKSLQAGLLATDSLILIDEAHLSPSFVETVNDIKKVVNEHPDLVSPLKVIPLSATIPSKESDEQASEKSLFNKEEELKNDIAKARLTAEKKIELIHIAPTEKKNKKKAQKEIEELLITKIVEKAAQYEKESCSVMIFVSTVKLVNKIGEQLGEKLGESSTERILKMTGEMRGFERDRLMDNEKFKAFQPQRDRAIRQQTRYMIATSCAEVGVNLDADHCVCDLVALPSMIQRNGRINRFGKTRSTITIVVDDSILAMAEEHIQAKKESEDAKQIVEKLSKETENTDGGNEGSTSRVKKQNLGSKYIEVYYTFHAFNGILNNNGNDASPLSLCSLNEPRAWPSPPVRPPFDISRIDDWAMTSLKQNEYPRPLVAYWLRGVTSDETAQTTFCWRADLNYASSTEQAEEMASAIPVMPQERATIATYRAIKFMVEVAKLPSENQSFEKRPSMKKSGKKLSEKLVVIVDPSGEYEAVTLRSLVEEMESLFSKLANSTVILPNKLGGLSADGNVLEKLPKKPTTVPDVVDDKIWIRYVMKRLNDGSIECGKLRNDGETENAVVYGQLKEALKKCTKDSGGICVNSDELQKTLIGPTEDSEESESENETSTKLPIEIAYFLNRMSSQRFLTDIEDVTSLGLDIGRTVEEHNSDVERKVKEIAEKIGLDERLIEALCIACRMHDRGKNRDWWQAAIGNEKEDKADWKPMAKTMNCSFDHNINDGYRHEFGSLVEAMNDQEILAHPYCDLILHLIASHHGYARPHFPSKGFDRNQPKAVNQRIAEETMLRFVRLQREFGWWQLAYLEALVKSADALASRNFSRWAP